MAASRPATPSASAPSPGRPPTGGSPGLPEATLGFDSRRLARLERLHLVARRLLGATQRAERRSRQLGSSLEFADYRLYAPGDDLRRIDWNVFGRLDRLFLKLFEEERDLPVAFLVDASQSMRWMAPATPASPGARTGPPRPSKFNLARQVAAALAYVSLTHLDQVSLHFFADELVGSLGLGRGRGQFRRALDFLGQAPAAAGETNLVRSLRDFGQRTRRRGLVIVLSDAFDPGGYREAFDFLRYRQFEVHLVHVLDPAERRPGLRGDLRLGESESARTMEVTVGPGLLRAYEREIDRFVEELEAFCRRRLIGYVPVSTADDLDEVIVRLLRTGLLVD